MATIVTRTGKGSALTIAELDANFNNLNTGKLEETPTRASVRPTLLLDFAKTKTLDPRVSFSRDSVGTYTDATGLLRVAPANTPRFDHSPTTGESLGLLVEEQRTNFLPYSEAFDSATAWSVDSGIVLAPNADVGPTGAMNACRVSFGANNKQVWSAVLGSPPTGTLTASIYIKGTAGQTIKFGLTGDEGVYTLDGTWQRLSRASSAYSSARVTLNTYSGVTALTVLVWGAQLEVGAFATSYIPSSVTFTGRSSTATFIGSNGLIQTAASGVARQQYNPLNLNADPFLLLEAAATNLLLQSEDLTVSPWSSAAGGNTSTRVNDNSALGFMRGLITATTTNGGIRQSISGLTSGATYVLSFYIQSTLSFVELEFENSASTFGLYHRVVLNPANGTSNSSAGFVGVASTAFGSGYIFTLRTAPAGGQLLANIEWRAASIGDSFFLGRAQFEVGAFSTSYIPTAASQVTRAADTSTSAQTTRAADLPRLNSVTPWWNTAQGTLFAEWQNNADAWKATQQMWVFAASAASPPNGSGISTGGTQLSPLRSGVSNIGDVTTGNVMTHGQVARGATGYLSNAHNVCLNGGNVETGGTNFVSQPVAVTLGQRGSNERYLNGWLRKFSYYPKSLANAELQAITTP